MGCVIIHKTLATQRGPLKILKVLDSYPGLLRHCQTLKLKLRVGQFLWSLRNWTWSRTGCALDEAFITPTPWGTAPRWDVSIRLHSSDPLVQGTDVHSPSKTFSSRGPTSAMQNLPNSWCWDSWACHQFLVQCHCATGHCISLTLPACLCFQEGSVSKQ